MLMISNCEECGGRGGGGGVLPSGGISKMAVKASKHHNILMTVLS